jgi:hypothetical protein
MPGSATECPDFNLTITDAGGVADTYRMPDDSGQPRPAPIQGGIGINGNKYCSYYLHYVGLSGPYTITTSLGGRTAVVIPAGPASDHTRICADVSADGYTCTPVPNPPPPVPQPVRQTIPFNLSLFANLPNYLPKSGEPIWYFARFPAFSGSGKLVDVGAAAPITIPTKGNSVSDCNDSSKVIFLGPGQFLGASGMTKVFGTSLVSFTGANQIQLAACQQTLETPAPTMTIYVTVEKD